MSGLLVVPPLWPLLRLPRLTADSAEERLDRAMRQATRPEDVWKAFRAERRSSPDALTRARARLDEAYRTTTPEYLDRADVSARRRERIVEALDRTHRVLGTYRRLCRLLLPVVADVARPRVLEVASGHGKLAIAIEKAFASLDISAAVTGSDLAPELVALAQRNALGAGSPVTFQRLDATQLNLPDDSMDLVVNALSMHHLPFDSLVRALSEMRRVSRRAVVFDLWRAPALFAPAAAVMLALSFSFDCTHDGMISMRKAWGTEEWRLAAELAGWPSMSIGLMLPGFLFLSFER